MTTDRHLTRARPWVPTAEALASFLRHLADRRGRSGRITSPETVRAYTSALPTAFTGIVHLGELASVGRDRLHTNIRGAWGGAAPSTFNAKRAAVASALAYFHDQGWIGDPAAVLHGLDREHQPRPDDTRVRSRERIDRPGPRVASTFICVTGSAAAPPTPTTATTTTPGPKSRKAAPPSSCRATAGTGTSPWRTSSPLPAWSWHRMQRCHDPRQADRWTSHPAPFHPHSRQEPTPMTHPDGQPARKPLTVIFAYDAAEAEQVRQDVGLGRGECMPAHFVEAIHGSAAVEVYVIETPRFALRPDADETRERIRLSTLRQIPHPDWNPTLEPIMRSLTDPVKPTTPGQAAARAAAQHGVLLHSEVAEAVARAVLEAHHVACQAKKATS